MVLCKSVYCYVIICFLLQVSLLLRQVQVAKRVGKSDREMIN